MAEKCGRDRGRRPFTVCAVFRAMKALREEEGCEAVELAIAAYLAAYGGCRSLDPCESEERWSGVVAATSVPAPNVPLGPIKIPEIKFPKGDFADSVKDAQERVREAREAAEEARKAIERYRSSIWWKFLFKWPWLRVLLVALVTAIVGTLVITTYLEPILAEAAQRAEDDARRCDEMQQEECKEWR